MKHHVSRDLHAYWDRLRGARATPESGDIDPAAIRAILAETFMADVTGEQSVSGRDFIVCSSGTRLNGLWRQELRRRSLLSLWRTEDRNALRELLDLVLNDRVPVVAGALGDGHGGRPIEFETLFLPLRHNGKTHARLFGAIASRQSDTWRVDEAIGPLALTSFRIISSSPERTEHPPLPPARHYGRFTVYEGGR